MSNTPPTPPPHLPLSQEELIQAIAQSLGEKLNLAIATDESLEVIADDIYPRYPRVIFVRKLMTGAVIGFLIYALINIFHGVFRDNPAFLWGVACSVATVVTGLMLILLLITEIFRGAGKDHELEIKQGSYLIKEYQFIPSLDRFGMVLFLLGICFLSILLGFASLYTDLWRHHPAHFTGLQDGFLAIYFSIVTFSTVGYGDIHPTSLLARTVAICEIFLAMFFSLVVLSTTLSWVLAHKRQQQEISIKQRIRERKQQRAQQQAT
ncbi:potassium channel family protein [Spirulina subsalsa FACHB-351]|uniref:Potassium channel family protein n=1 Tax=Spirulina subsalsa FACHB-351 TaxID=234711 RepID=A0ABT3L7A5_9CYAN|nr:potassium channel family protein [Spirulina subsalsa]MCW6037062.1 potassium channel family protein [Spirulina subsalsa FACHB-351]